MKKALIILTTIILIVSIFTGCASNKSSNENGDNPLSVANKSKASDMDCFITYDNQTIEGLTDKGRKQKNLVIPANFTSIYGLTFDSSEVLESISFENPDLELSKGLFYYCSNLKEVTLPQNLKEIPDLCFCDCSSLKSIVIPDTVTKIGERAFCDCTVLEKVTFGTSLQSIEEDAFSYTAITELNFPSSVKTIGEDAFRYCDSLTSVVINEGTETLERFAFADCHKLESVVLPESISSIDDSFAHTGTVGDVYADLKISVVKGSWADVHFDEFASNMWNAGEMIGAEKAYK